MCRGGVSELCLSLCSPLLSRPKHFPGCCMSSAEPALLAVASVCVDMRPPPFHALSWWLVHPSQRLTTLSGHHGRGSAWYGGLGRQPIKHFFFIVSDKSELIAWWINVRTYVCSVPKIMCWCICLFFCGNPFTLSLFLAWRTLEGCLSWMDEVGGKPCKLAKRYVGLRCNGSWDVGRKRIRIWFDKYYTICTERKDEDVYMEVYVT